MTMFTPTERRRGEWAAWGMRIALGILAIGILLSARATAWADEVVYIDLLPPAETVAEPGDIVAVQYHACPADEETAQYCGLQAYITWDPECLVLLDWEEGDYDWWNWSGWIMSGAGELINETWDDGDAALMLFDEPGDDDIPTAPHHSFSLLFYVLEPGCVRIDEWWCPPSDPDCDQVVPIRTRISDLWGRPCERELGEGCVVEDDEVAPNNTDGFGVSPDEVRMVK